MYELIKINERDYYIDAPTRVGIYRVSNDEVYLIDAGSDRPYGKTIKKILDDEGWTLKAIFITHAHADHIGGARFLTRATGAKAYAPPLEAEMAKQTILEPMSLYGGMAPPYLMYKFFQSEEVDALPLTDDVLPEGLSVINLEGHTLGMVGYVTDGGTAYIADAISSVETYDKYKVCYVYSPERFFATLKTLRELTAKTYVPSHADVSEDISEIIEFNLNKMVEHIQLVKDILREERSSDDAIFEVFRRLDIEMNFTQYALVGSTVRSIIAHLVRTGPVGVYTENYKLTYKTH